jgi:hypothetical protein
VNEILERLGFIPGPEGEPGARGRPGRDGKDGAPGRPGRDGRDGADGKDGAPGVDGKDGKDGRDGEDGRDGQDAMGLVPATATFERDPYTQRTTRLLIVGPGGAGLQLIPAHDPATGRMQSVQIKEYTR